MNKTCDTRELNNNNRKKTVYVLYVEMIEYDRSNDDKPKEYQQQR